MDSDQKITHQHVGAFIFVIFCGIPALMMNGFWNLGIDFTLQGALISAAIGGLVGGACYCPRPILAGIVGGLVAGPLGLLVVYYYTQQRQQVWNLELVIAQLIGSLPGVAVGYLIKRAVVGPDAKEHDPSATPIAQDRFRPDA